MTHGTIAHEALHVVDFLFKKIGEEFQYLSESRSYFMGWVVDKIYEAMLENKIKFKK